MNMLHDIVLDTIRKLRRHRIISRIEKFVSKVNGKVINQPTGIITGGLS